jgi:hypothetical protein
MELNLNGLSRTPVPVDDRTAPSLRRHPDRRHSMPVHLPRIDPSRANSDAPCRESGKTDVLSRIRAQLEQHPHFRGRTSLFTIEWVGETLVLSGRVPTYYLKQLLQEAVRKMPGVAAIDNRVCVMDPGAPAPPHPTE